MAFDDGYTNFSSHDPHEFSKRRDKDLVDIRLKSDYEKCAILVNLHLAGIAIDQSVL